MWLVYALLCVCVARGTRVEVTSQTEYQRCLQYTVQSVLSVTVIIEHPSEYNRDTPGPWWANKVALYAHGDSEPTEQHPVDASSGTGYVIFTHARVGRTYDLRYYSHNGTDWGMYGALHVQVLNAAPPPQWDLDPMNTPDAELSLLVPLYIYPTASEWTAVATAARRVRITAIVNPATGPGNTVDSEYEKGIQNLVDSGVTVLGYVNADSRRRSVTDVQADVERWPVLYPMVHGVWIDAATPTVDDLHYYMALSAAATTGRSHAQVMMNVGEPSALQYRSLVSTSVFFTGAAAKWDTHKPPCWATYSTSNAFGALVDSCPDTDCMRRAILLAQERNYRHVFVTNRGGDKPFATLPEYWKDEVEFVAATTGHHGEPKKEGNSHRVRISRLHRKDSTPVIIKASLVLGGGAFLALLSGLAWIVRGRKFWRLREEAEVEMEEDDV